MSEINYGLERGDVVNIQLTCDANGTQLANLVEKYNWDLAGLGTNLGWTLLSRPGGSGDTFEFCALADEAIQVAVNGNSSELLGFIKIGETDL